MKNPRQYFLPYLLKYNFNTILDIGTGKDDTIVNYLLNNKKIVYSNDIFQYLDCNHMNYTFIKGDFLSTKFNQKFDTVLASHVLEHIQNIGLFLDKVYTLLNNDGVFFCIVPPYKSKVVGGHLTPGWNIGILMYNLIIAGFDVRNGRFKKQGNNIVGFVKKRNNKYLPKLINDYGDIDALKSYFPKGSYFHHRFEGDLKEWNWFKE